MNTEIKVPILPASVSEAKIAALHVKEGEQVNIDQQLIDLDTDKVVLEIVAPFSGIITKIQCDLDDSVKSEQVVMEIKPLETRTSQTSTDAHSTEIDACQKTKAKTTQVSDPINLNDGDKKREKQQEKDQEKALPAQSSPFGWGAVLVMGLALVVLLFALMNR